MPDRVFAAAYLFLATLLGWVWHIAQAEGVPFLIRVAAGLAATALLYAWLTRRLRAGRRPRTGGAR